MLDETEAPLLGSLLEDDYFLIKVLIYLVEYGLQECRLVCRQWREASRRLSVELTLSCQEESVNSLEGFPVARKVTLQGGWRNEGFIGEVQLCEQILQKLKSSNSLQSFSTGMRTAILFSEFVPSRELVFEKLQSLTMGTWFNDHAAGDQLVSSLQHLTKLTRLELRGKVYNWASPAVRMTSLKHLTADISLIVNEWGQLCFPALTQLTHLAVLSVEQDQNLWRRGRVLTLLGPYQRSLRSLRLSTSLCLGEVDGISALTEFWSLQSLSFYLKQELYEEFFSIRRDLVQLTELCIGAASLNSTLIATVFSLLNLRSLSLCDIRAKDRRLYNLPFSSFTNLKELNIKRADINNQWIPPPSLTKLHIEGRRGYVGSVFDDMDAPGGACISKENILKLHHLEELTIKEFRVDKDLFVTLAKLPALVNLSVARLTGIKLPYVYSHLNDITQLERLTIEPEGTQCLLSTLKEGKLIRLRYLELFPKRITTKDTTALFKALPCLRIVRSSVRA